MKKALNGIYNGSKNGFKVTDLVLRKIDEWRNKALFPLIRRYWPDFILPNHLTYLRFIIALLIAWSIFIYTEINDYHLFRVIVPLYIIGIISDLIDGPIARCLGKTSRFGAFLDASADKALNLVIGFYLLIKSYPVLFMAILIPEIISFCCAVVCYCCQQKVESNIFGKTKMFLQSASYLFIMFFSIKPLILVILWSTTVFTIVSLTIKFWEFSTQKEYGTQT